MGPRLTWKASGLGNLTILNVCRKAEERRPGLRGVRGATIYLSPTGRTQCSVSMPLSTSFKWSHHQMIVMMAIIQRKRQDTNFAVDHLRYFRDVPLVCLLEAHFYLWGTKVEDFPGCNPLGRRLHRDCYNCLHCHKSLWWTDLDSFCSTTCG